MGAKDQVKTKAVPGRVRLQPVASTQFIRKANAKRLAARAGVQRTTEGTRDFISELGSVALERVIYGACRFADMANRTTLSEDDVKESARVLDLVLFGMEGKKARRKTKAAAKPSAPTNSTTTAA